MSCHNIGRGVNTIVKSVLELYDKKEISFKAAKKLIIKSRDAVNWCDGNYNEALECMEASENIRCSCCLEKKNKEDLLNVYDLPEELYEKYGFLENEGYGDKIVSRFVCRDCANKMDKEKN